MFGSLGRQLSEGRKSIRMPSGSNACGALAAIVFTVFVRVGMATEDEPQVEEGLVESLKVLDCDI